LRQLEFQTRKPDHISFSQIRTYQRCPRLWYLEKMMGYESPETPAMALGKCVHLALANYTKMYMENHIHSKDDMQLAWREAVKDVDEIKGLLSFQDYSQGASWLSELLDTDLLYLDWAMNVEYEFRVEFGGVTVEGRIDRVDDMDGVYRLVDYKSGFMIVDHDLVDTDLQLALYAAAWQDVTGIHTDDIRVAMLDVRTLTYAETAKTQEELDAIRAYVVDCARRIERDKAFEPTPGDSCMVYGGCWAASLCPAIGLNRIRTGDGDIDLSQFSNEELLRLYATVELVAPRIRATLRGKAADTGTMEGEGNMAQLIARTRSVARDEVFAEFLDMFIPYGLNVANCCNVSKTKMEKERHELAGKILESESLDWPTKQTLIRDMEMMLEAMFQEKATTPGISVVAKVSEDVAGRKTLEPD